PSIRRLRPGASLRSAAMSIQAKCPSCRSIYELSDDLEGKKVRCKRCEQTFVAGASASRKSRRADDEEEEERGTGITDRPRGSAAPVRAGARRRAVDDDDDDDELPQRRRPSGGNSTLLWIVGGAMAGLFLLAVIGVGAFFALRSRSNTQAQIP